jgi:hypothetical protein
MRAAGIVVSRNHSLEYGFSGNGDYIIIQASFVILTKIARLFHIDCDSFARKSESRVTSPDQPAAILETSLQ